MAVTVLRIAFVASVCAAVSMSSSSLAIDRAAGTRQGYKLRVDPDTVFE